MEFTFPMKILEQLLASSLEQFSEPPTEGRTGFRKRAKQPASCGLFALVMPIPGPSLVIKARFSEQPMEGKRGLVRPAACLTFF
jgi:hypothetical protein